MKKILRSIGGFSHCVLPASLRINFRPANQLWTKLYSTKSENHYLKYAFPSFSNQHTDGSRPYKCTFSELTDDDKIELMYHKRLTPSKSSNRLAAQDINLFKVLFTKYFKKELSEAKFFNQPTLMWPKQSDHVKLGAKFYAHCNKALAKLIGQPTNRGLLSSTGVLLRQHKNSILIPSEAVDEATKKKVEANREEYGAAVAAHKAKGTEAIPSLNDIAEKLRRDVFQLKSDSSAKNIHSLDDFEVLKARWWKISAEISLFQRGGLLKPDYKFDFVKHIQKKYSKTAGDPSAGPGQIQKIIKGFVLYPELSRSFEEALKIWRTRTKESEFADFVEDLPLELRNIRNKMATKSKRMSKSIDL